MPPGPILITECAFDSQPRATSQTWTDVSAWFAGLSSRRGRNRELDRFMPATCTTQFVNRDRRFEPEYSGSPYFPNVKPMRRLRHRVLSRNRLPYGGFEDDAGAYHTPAGLAAYTTGIGDTAPTLTGVRTSAPQLAGSTQNLRVQQSGTNTGYKGFSFSLSGLTIGVDYLLSVYVWLDAGDSSATRDIRVFVHTDPGGTAGDAETVTTMARGQWVRVVVPFTPVAATGTAYVRSTDQAPIWYADHGQLEADDGTHTPSAWMPYFPDTVLAGGFVEDWGPDWVGRNDAVNSVQVVGAFGSLLAAKKLNTGLGYPDQVLADGATDYYRLDDLPIAGLANNTVAARTDGTYKGQVILGAAGALLADPNTAMSLVGYTGWVDLGTGPSLTGAGALTFECWIWPSGAGSVGTDRFFCQNPAVTGSDFINIYMQSGGYIQLQYVAGAVTFTLDSDHAVNLFDGKWHHIVWTRASNGVTNKLYVDGVLSASGTATAAGAFTSNPVLIGGSGTGPGDAAFNGMVDEVAFYSTELTSAKVTTHASYGPPGWGVQKPGPRLGKILDVIGVPAGDRNLETGLNDLQAATHTLIQQDALAYMQAVADSEQQGRLFEAADGTTIVFHGGDHSAPDSAGIFGDGGGLELPYTPGTIKPSYSVAEVFNEAAMQRIGGRLQVAHDDVSKGDYGIRSLPPKTGLLNSNDADVLALAESVVGIHKDPTMRFTEIVLDPYADPRLWPHVVGREIGDAITLARRPPGGGSTVTRDARIEGISHDIDAKTKRWKTTWRLSVLYGLFTLDDPTLGLLDANVLA